jgi:hypothetical protein
MSLILVRNPNVAFPRECYDSDTLEWIDYRKGHRIYNTALHDRWQWNYDFHVTRGEVFFDASETDYAKRYFMAGSIIIEPNVPARKGVYITNKAWGLARYQEVVNVLTARGHNVYQFLLGDRPILKGVRRIQAHTFRQAVAILKRASLYIGTEGGLHHGAAAVGTPAVVLFGGWLPPSVLGYESHVNLTGGETEACGLFRVCEHCRQAMTRISTDEVLAAAMGFLEGGSDAGHSR